MDGRSDSFRWVSHSRCFAGKGVWATISDGFCRPTRLASGCAAATRDGRSRPDGRLLVDRPDPRPQRAADRSRYRINLHRRARKSALELARTARNDVQYSVQSRSLCFSKIVFIPRKARELPQSCATCTVLAQHRTHYSVRTHNTSRRLTGYHSTHTTPRRISGAPTGAARRVRAV